jgi:hypothetical protein
MKPALSRSAPPEGLHFAMADLQVAMSWAGLHSNVRLSVVLDHSYIPEAIHIGSPGSKVTRWCIWRDHKGHLWVEDWLDNEFGLPYQTVTEALGFIGSRMANSSGRNAAGGRSQ